MNAKKNGMMLKYTGSIRGLWPLSSAESQLLSRANVLLIYMGIAFAASYVLAYAIIAFIRLQFPFELEWMEGGIVDHVRRVLEGEKLYVSPSLDFTPFLYPPLYYYVSAVTAKIVGIGLEPLRFISITSSLVAMTFIFLIVYRETGKTFPAIVSTGVFAATYEISGAWLDIARVDSLFLALLLAGVYIFRFHSTTQGAITAGILLALSYFTKQTALFVIVPLALYALLVGWNQRRFLFFIGTSAGLVVGGTLLLNAIHDGWYWYYVFNLPGQHLIVRKLILGFWSGDLVKYLPIAIAFIAFYAIMKIKGAGKRDLFFYGLLTAGMIGGAYYSRLHSGGWSNVLIPAYAVITILFGLAVHAVFQRMEHEPARRIGITQALVSIAILAQFALLIYNPVSYIPSQEDIVAGNRLIRLIEGIEEEVFVPNHSYIPSLAGKEEVYAQGAAMADIFRSKDESAKAKLGGEIRYAIEQKRFGAIILDTHQFGFHQIAPELEQHYRPKRLIFADDSVFWPVTGWRTRPETIYLPK